VGNMLAERAAEFAALSALSERSGEERGRALGPAAPADPAILVVDVRGQVRHCTGGAAGLLGRSPTAVHGSALSELMPELPLRRETPGYNLAYLILNFGPDLWHEMSVLGADGQSRVLMMSFAVLHLDRHNWLLVSLREPEPAAQSRDHLEQLIARLAGSPEPAMITTASGLIAYANPAYEALTGYRLDELVGQGPSLLKSGLHPPEFYQTLWQTLNDGGTYHAVFTDRAKGGRLFYLDETIRPFMDRQGQITHFVATGRDISAQVVAQQELKHRADFDGLTGLANRYLLRDRLHQEIARARREAGMFALVCVDLDGFKGINDRLGHLAGDAALRAVAAQLAQAVREMDTVARWGGDEFLLILPGVFEPVDLASVLSKILASVAGVPSDPKTRTPITLSAGAAIFPADADDADELIRKADLAMYQAKIRGGNGYCAWDTALWQRGGRGTRVPPELPHPAPAAPAREVFAAPLPAQAVAAPSWRARAERKHLTCVQGGAKGVRGGAHA
jgi:diguanylate cyclase (GGDEF)-like protein/PAS domain S-box-containing protein